MKPKKKSRFPSEVKALVKVLLDPKTDPDDAEMIWFTLEEILKPETLRKKK